MKTFEFIGIAVPEVLLPKQGIELKKWAVVACDQYTSQPDYWEKVLSVVGDSPSTLKIILPEIYLGKPEEEQLTQKIAENMKKYIESGILVSENGFIYVERMAGGKLRKGLMVAVDLEKYDYSKKSESLIRATEGTILERLPPRMNIRQKALIELPHIMVLIDDPKKTVIEPLANVKTKLHELYDFELMLNSGHLAGYLIDNAEIESGIARALQKLAEPAAFSKKYYLKNKKTLLFAVGDGNHSLATAKAIWERKKQEAKPKDKKAIMNDPARYALVELVNVHDSGLHFEPIHRVLFGVKKDVLSEMKDVFKSKFSYTKAKDSESVIKEVDSQKKGKEKEIQKIGFFSGKECGVIEINKPTANLAVGTLQNFLDKFLKDKKAESIDYVHGKDVVLQLAANQGSIGFYLPAMEKSELFRTVLLEGALPRKTFSMGAADEKRFYMESRKIV